MLRINIFTPSFNKTGSEVALFNLVNSSADSFEMKVVSNTKGELGTELPESVPYFDIESYSSILPGDQSIFIQRVNKVIKYFRTDEKYLKRFNKKHPADLWYINTIMMPSVVSFAWKNKIPFVLHVHELEQMFAKLTESQFRNVVNYPSLIIACSNTCEEALKWSGRKDGIKVCYPGLDLEKISKGKQRSDLIRKKYNIDNDAFVWIMSGTMDINKNPSLFVEIANYILRKNQKAYFIWLVNGREDNGYVSHCLNKTNELGISDKVIWASNLNEEYHDYFASGDGFVLTSSRESFSIVTVEALSLGKPVVSFDCGGVSEIINDTNGIVVKCKSVEAIGDAMIKVMNKEFVFEPSLLRRSVEKFDIRIQQKNWRQIIEDKMSII
jgi:L-malate glycosyltransferase